MHSKKKALYNKFLPFSIIVIIFKFENYCFTKLLPLPGMFKEEVNIIEYFRLNY